MLSKKKSDIDTVSKQAQRIEEVEAKFENVINEYKLAKEQNKEL